MDTGIAPDFESFDMTHASAGADFVRHVAGFASFEFPDRPEAGPTPDEVVAGIVDAAKALKKPKRVPGPRRSGPGTEKRDPKKRSASDFEARSDEVAEARGQLREARARRDADREIKEASDRGMTVDELRADKQREFEAADKAIRQGYATPEQIKLAYDVEQAHFFAKRSAEESTRNAVGAFEWKGGEVGTSGCYRAPFQKKGFKSSLHHHYKRFAASCGRAYRRNLLAGNRKDGCWRHSKKVFALDRIYVFFCAVCFDMWRIDIDRSFKDYEEFRAWIDHVVREHDLPCAPHIVCWIPDDRRPGQVLRPHLFFLLPEGSAVWPHSEKSQHDKLRSVIVKTQEVFGGDRGGNCHPFSGKNPLSWLVESRIVQPERMPDLQEWFEAVGGTFVPNKPLPGLVAGAMEAAALGEESGGWFPCVREAGFAMAKEIHNAGRAKLADRKAFAGQIAKSITDPLTAALRPTAEQAAKLAALIVRVAKHTAETFDPSKMDKKGRRRGAAAHLIEPVMTLKERYAVGGEFSGPVRIEKTVELLAESMRLDMLCGREPTVAGITAKGIRCAKTVARHFDAAYSLAKSRMLAPKINAGKPVELRALFRSNPLFPADILVPGQAEATVFAVKSDPPEASAPAIPDKTIDLEPADILGTTADEFDPDDFMVDALSRVEHAKRRRLRPSEVRAGTQARQPGSLLAAFMASGVKTVHRSIKNPVLRSAVA
ncbi:cell envelope integrity protein TolA [Bradyrhizobium sp. SBR1B]|uniref:cell envelope integrity protein TolA n=1 Tax=Bradyrhizobium sp. SBR1B TaxID=2663836 RepID=UPI001606B407|nr:hypothetical protein [Bradyrhizobium sp. SBR1B]MBB4377324.1 hypothetical protein [Bradyrhizobium sp. SBR1B]